jgi:hypothetical protein
MKRGGMLYTEDLTYGGRMYPPEVTGKWGLSVEQPPGTAEDRFCCRAWLLHFGVRTQCVCDTDTMLAAGNSRHLISADVAMIRPIKGGKETKCKVL